MKSEPPIATVASRLPKHRQVYEVLLEHISSGRYPPGTRLPPETELPGQLGASLQTTRQALQELVRNGLLVRRRGDGTYVADLRDPPLIDGRTLRIGILLPTEVCHRTIFYTFEGAVSQGILRQWGAADTPYAQKPKAKHGSTRSEWAQPKRGLMIDCLGEPIETAERHPSLEDVRAGRYDALISIGVIEAGWIGELLELGLPTVIVDFPNAPFHTRADLVFADAYGGYQSAIQYLIAQGLRRIHYVGARKWVPSKPGESVKKWARTRSQMRLDPDCLLRLNAYRQGMDVTGLGAQDDWVHFCLANERGQEELVDSLMAMEIEHRPEALVCQDVGMANAMIERCGRRGLHLLGVGASSLPHPGPSLGITLDGEEMGRVAAELVLARLERPKRPYLNVGVRMAFSGT